MDHFKVLILYKKNSKCLNKSNGERVKTEVLDRIQTTMIQLMTMIQHAITVNIHTLNYCMHLLVFEVVLWTHKNVMFTGLLLLCSGLVVLDHHVMLMLVGALESVS